VDKGLYLRQDKEKGVASLMSVLSVNKAKASQTMTADICSPLIGQRSLMFISSKNTGWEVSFSSILTLTGTKAREKGSN
jgi:hypothetical protein